MKNLCTECRQEFEITPEDQRFLDLFQVPAPLQCPDCRLQRRLCERNTRCLYFRKCDLTGQQIISQYNTDQPFPVYSIDAWVSDRWDGVTYGRAFDFARPFFEQYKDLLDIVPHLALFNTPGTMENSDFNNATGYLKNCYLLSESDICEDSYYCNLLKSSKDLCDSSVCYECERCYECVDCISCHTLIFSQDCLQCSESAFLKNCHNCKDCIGCINQRNKQYMIFNQQYAKEEYEKQKATLAPNTRTGLHALSVQCDDFFSTQPHRALTTERSEDCSGDRIYDCKSAHHCFDVKNIEDCRHCERLSLGCKTCMDFNSWGQNSELVYQCSATGDRTYNSKFCSTCITVTNAEYCFECFHCSDCFGCVGLRNKKYCILNEQYTKGEFEKKWNECMFGSHQGVTSLKKKFQEFTLTQPHRYMTAVNQEGCTGNYIQDSKHCIECFHAHEAEDCKFGEHVWRSAKDCMDVVTAGRGAEMLYETTNTNMGAARDAFCIQCWSSNDVFYSSGCCSCAYCFGCVSLKHACYCIFNTQYTKDEYEKLVPKIIDHMRKTGEFGEFFPASIAVFGYNETVAQEQSPLTQKETLARGWKWKEEERLQEKYLGPALEISDDIRDASDDMTKKILLCKTTSKPYKIIPQELTFCREMNIPIPRECPDQRHKERMSLRNPSRLWNRTCAKCQKDIQTTYAPERPETVVCEECYLKTVY